MSISHQHYETWQFSSAFFFIFKWTSSRNMNIFLKSINANHRIICFLPIVNFRATTDWSDSDVLVLVPIYNKNLARFLTLCVCFFRWWRTDYQLNVFAHFASVLHVKLKALSIWSENWVKRRFILGEIEAEIIVEIFPRFLIEISANSSVLNWNAFSKRQVCM